jgi:hypothetical protein
MLWPPAAIFIVDAYRIALISGLKADHAVSSLPFAATRSQQKQLKDQAGAEGERGHLTLGGFTQFTLKCRAGAANCLNKFVDRGHRGGQAFTRIKHASLDFGESYIAQAAAEPAARAPFAIPFALPLASPDPWGLEIVRFLG